MILQLSSPGAIILFVALPPQFVDPSRSVAHQVANRVSDTLLIVAAARIILITSL
ncbi:MAG TPA: hypothetical protein VKR29_04725 [Candidatus Binataceae bacterium]|nr:hypothetical protein [Candidatus Binataceae bacterium]